MRKAEKSMFELRNVKYKGIVDIPVLTIRAARVTTLMGPSGSGKTTILKLLNKLISPDEGCICYGGEDLSQIDSVAHRRRVTMLSQTPTIFEGTVKDNLAAGLRFQRRTIPGDETLADMLQKVKLEKALDSSAQTLSGGEKQRLVLARVLLLDAETYLLDEPSSALDEATAEAVIEMIVEFTCREKKTLVMVTHAKEIARRYSDDIVEVGAGGQI